MQKFFWPTLLIITLTIAGAGIFMVSNLSKEAKEAEKNLSDTVQNINYEIDVLERRTSPFISTGEAAGYVIKFENGKKFYFGGDTGIIADMKLVVGDYYKPDVAILPIGDIYTMDVQGAAYAASLVNPTSYVIPAHYNSFPMLMQDTEEFKAELAKYNLRSEAVILEEGKEETLLGVKIVWLGHGAWYFESPEGVKVLIDPEIEYNPAYPEEYKNLDVFGNIDMVLITHGHFDHMTIPDMKRLAQRFSPIIIAPFEAGIWLKDVLGYKDILAANKGCSISQEEMRGMGISADKVEKIGNIEINMVTAAHSSSATPEGSPARY